MPTTSAVPSADPSDLLFNAQKLDEVINGAADSFVDRRGVERLTLTGALRLIGFEAPVAFTTGLSITRSTQTVTNGGNTYHADPASLPFTTTGTFNGAQWRLVSNVTQADLTTYAIPRAGAADLAASFKTTGTWEATGFTLDANSLWSLVSSNPTWQADAGDTMSYNRASNRWTLTVGGAERFYVTAADGPARGADAATNDGLPRKSQVESLISGAVANRMQYSLVAAQDTTSGTAIDFTGIPSWAKRITVMFFGVSGTTAAAVKVRALVGGVEVTSGYVGTYFFFGSGSSAGTVTDAFCQYDLANGATNLHGHTVLTLMGSNTWTCNGSVARHGGAAEFQQHAGSAGLSGTPSGIRLLCTAGTFDGGSAALLIEG